MGPEFTRFTTLITMTGGGEEGVGEDVVYDGLDHVALQDAGAVHDLSGPSTLGELAELLDTLDLFPAPPVREASLNYRRWAFESAALDLALRQAGKSLGEVVGREPAPLHLRRLDAAEGLQRRGPRDRGQGPPAARALPLAAVQARPDQRLDRGAGGRAGRHGRGRVGRPQGPLPRHARGRGHRPGAVPDGGRGAARRLDRGPRPLGARGRRRCSSPTATASPGTPPSTRSTTSRRCRSRRRP